MTLSVQACSKRGLQASGTSRDWAVRVPLAIICSQRLQSEPYRVVPRYSSLLLRTIAEIEHARNPSRPSSAIRSLGQASRRTREQDAFHHAKNGHSIILDRHLEATDRMIESQERRYPHPRPNAELDTRAEPNPLLQRTQVPLELERINSQRCERRQSRCSPQ